MPYGKCVSYRIKGTHDAKGINDAIKSMQRLKKAGDAINTAFKTLVVGTVMKGIKAATNGATEAFMKQNEAVIKFNTSIQKANLSIKQMTDLRSKMSRNNFFDDDSLNNAMSMAAQMGLNEKQIENVMTAATDMAASGVMPLDQAVKTLSATYSGNSGQLKKLYPEVANLTKEQLEQGKAVDILKSKYAGFADTMADTFSGRDTQFKNTFSDLQASVGSVMQSVKFVSQGAIMEPMKKITEFINEHRDQIVKFFINLPEIAKVTVLNIWEIVKRTFSGDGIKNLLIFLGSSILAQAKFSIQTIFGLVKSLGTDILAIFDFLFGNLWRNTQDLLANIGNKLIDVLNSAFQKVLSAPGIKQLYEWLSGNKVSDAQIITFQFKNDHASENKSWADVTSTISNSTTQLVEDFKRNTTAYINAEKSNLDSFVGNYADLNEKTVADIKGILGKDLPADLKKAIAAGMQSGQSSDAGGGTGAPGTPGTSKGMEFLKSLLGTLGQLGQVIQAVMSSNWIGLLIQFLGSLSQSLANQSESWNKLLNCMSTVTDIIAEIIGPLWEEIFKPFADGLNSIGKIVGNLLLPILQLVSSIITPLNTVLTEFLNFVSDLLECISPLLQFVSTLLALFNPLMPILEAICAVLRILMKVITWLYNKILVPVINGIITIFTYVGNAFIWIYKQIYKVLDWIKLPTSISISWSGIHVGWDSIADLIGMKDKSYLNADDYKVKELSTSGTDDSSTSGGSAATTGAAASYTAARDIYVTINYNNSYVNGDAREIALNLRDEIRSAERLGL